MINPKYDPNNYVKHQAISVIVDNQKSNELYGSYLLRIKWWHTDTKQLPKSNLVGTLRVHISTPMGDLKPVDYQLEISSHKNIYIQFLTIPVPEFDYKIEIIHPTGITRSMLEIWEYNDPQTYLSNQLFSSMSGQSNPAPAAQSDPATVAALTQLVANTAATNAAIVASDEAVQNFDNFPVELLLAGAGYVAAANNKMTAIDRNCREIIISNNNLAGSLKLLAVPPADGTAYNLITNITGNPIAPGGSFVINEPTSRDEWFIAGSVAGMKVNFTKSVKV